ATHKSRPCHCGGESLGSHPRGQTWATTRPLSMGRGTVPSTCPWTATPRLRSVTTSLVWPATAVMPVTSLNQTHTLEPNSTPKIVRPFTPRSSSGRPGRHRAKRHVRHKVRVADRKIQLPRFDSLKDIPRIGHPRVSVRI